MGVAYTIRGQKLPLGSMPSTLEDLEAVEVEYECTGVFCYGKSTHSLVNLGDCILNCSYPHWSIFVVVPNVQRTCTQLCRVGSRVSRTAARLKNYPLMLKRE